MAVLTVGLTGGLASGKSTVARRLARAGLAVVDADQIVAALYAAGRPGARVVADLFGAALLTPEGAVDKPTLARLVFADPAARERLEAAIHPLVRQSFSDFAAATDGIAVLEATKLVEAGLAEEFDIVITVEAPEPIRLARARRRGLSRSEAEGRMAAQAPQAARRAAAGIVIENRGDLRRLDARVRQVVDELSERARLRSVGGQRES